MILSLSAIGSAVSGLKTASDTLTSMVEAKNTIDFQGKAIELQSQILSAQSSALAAQSDQMQLLAKIGELERQIADLENWKSDAENYTLVEVGNGNLVYSARRDVQLGLPPHYLCPNCFANQRKSILQPETRLPGRAEVLLCPSCGTDLYLTGHRIADHAGMKTRR